MSPSNFWKSFAYKWSEKCCSFRGRAILLSGLVTTALLSLGQTLQITESLELLLFDHGVRATNDQGSDSRLLVVGLTDEDIANYGWPLPEPILAKLLRNLQAQEARVIGLDLYRHRVQSQELAEEFKQDNVVSIFKVDEEGKFPDEAKDSILPRSQMGFSDLVIDKDGVVRRSLLFVDSTYPDTEAFYSFALKTTLNYLNIGHHELLAEQDSLKIRDISIPALHKGDGGYQKVDDSGYQILLRYRDRLSPAIEISVTEVLENTADPELIKDKIVLIGSINSSIKDYFYTPYSAKQTSHFVMPGVFVHAQIISHLLDIFENDERAVYYFIPVWLEPIFIFSLTILVGYITWDIKRIFYKLVVISILSILILLTSYTLLLSMVWIPTADLILGVLLSTTLMTGQRLLYQSAYDELTQLPKREVFIRQTTQKLRKIKTQSDISSVNIAFIDLERIKLFNRILGYSTGEKITKKVVDKLKCILPSTSSMARLGDTEFVIFWLTEDSKDSFCLEVIQKKLDEPIQFFGKKLILNSHIGVAKSSVINPLNSGQLIQIAHSKMHQSKLSQRSKRAFSHDRNLNDDSYRLSLESHLLEALETKKFELFYQPIVALDTGTISGFEALVRWPQEDGSYASPESFIPVAEEVGLILPLSEWIIETAFCQLSQWKEHFPDKELTISVNLSGHQFDQDNLLTVIHKALSVSHLRGTDVHFEITESMVMQDMKHAVLLMTQLRKLGIKLDMDDFGTGYSSLSYLHQLPLDTIKIDKSFISRIQYNLRDSAIVNAILGISRSLEMDVVAEGIETATQAQVLRESSCTYGQGYFFNRPLNVTQATEVLKNSILYDI